MWFYFHHRSLNGDIDTDANCNGIKVGQGHATCIYVLVYLCDQSVTYTLDTGTLENSYRCFKSYQ